MNAGWRDSARCAEVDPELFFPEKGHSPMAARLICGRCEVRLACLAWALAHPGVEGVWGGLTERERRPSQFTAPSGAPPPVTARQAARNRARLEAELRDAARSRRAA